MAQAEDMQVLVEAVGLTDVGSVRETNEDIFTISDLTTGHDGTGPLGARYHVGPRGVLLAVSDGMGGAQAGEIASALVVESVCEHLKDDCRATDLLESIRCAVERANQDVLEAARAAGREGMGATLVAVLVHEALAHIAWVGDSRAYVVRGGQIRQVTKDQSYVEMLIDNGAMTREEAERSPWRNVILQAMGQPNVKVALGRAAMRKGDMFLLCSDGLSGKVTAEEILRVISQSPDDATTCARLVELANARGGEDNITVVVARVNGDALPAPHPAETVTQTITAIPDAQLPPPR